MDAGAGTSGLEVRRLRAVIDAEVILDRVSLTVEQGQLMALVGPSGSGKSTLLQCITGLLPAAAGSILWEGVDITAVPTHLRRFGMVFQEPLLFPHLDVAGNVGYGLRTGRHGVAAARSSDGAAELVDGPAVKARVDELLEMVALGGFGGRRPDTLSGGEAQRVALARALAPVPRLLLLDEPFAALDRDLRLRLADDVATLLRATRTTAILVTHDQEEAERLGDRLVRLTDLSEAPEAQ